MAGLNDTVTWTSIGGWGLWGGRGRYLTFGDLTAWSLSVLPIALKQYPNYHACNTVEQGPLEMNPDLANRSDFTHRLQLTLSGNRPRVHVIQTIHPDNTQIPLLIRQIIPDNDQDEKRQESAIEKKTVDH